MHIVSVGTPIFWLGFTLLVVLMLAIDLGVFHRDAHEVKFKEALIWSIVWTSLAAIFCLCSAFWFGKTHALEFATGYIIEWALSVDNIFIFVIIFTYFAVPKNLHHRVLFWGIIGAVVMRAIFIFAGTALLQRFHFVMYFFGALLLFTSFRLFIQKETDIHPDRNPILRLFRKFFPVVSKFHGANFWVKENGRWHATPLFLVLLVVEVTDLIFAVDSIPAIFAITSDPFIVFTSNIFAIMGLRSLYFLISGVMDKFHYLKIGLATVLAFIGTKMLIADFFKIPTVLSLIIVATLIFGSIIVSLLHPPKPH
jgi:tellurite resistance protein TerC